jgi:hypothetical protein
VAKRSRLRDGDGGPQVAVECMILAQGAPATERDAAGLPPTTAAAAPRLSAAPKKSWPPLPSTQAAAVNAGVDLTVRRWPRDEPARRGLHSRSDVGVVVVGTRAAALGVAAVIAAVAAVVAPVAVGFRLRRRVFVVAPLSVRRAAGARVAAVGARRAAGAPAERRKTRCRRGRPQPLTGSGRRSLQARLAQDAALGCHWPKP